MHQLPFSTFKIIAKKPLELVYFDLWGPSPIVSIEGYRYYVIFVDAYTRYTWLYQLKRQSNALSTFVTFHKFAELQYQSKLKTLQFDNGGEFQAFLPYFRDHGIQPHLTCLHTHQQIGVAKWKHRHIAEMCLTLLAHVHMPLKFWLEAFQTAVYIINMLLSSPLNFASSFELLYHKQPNYLFFQLFRCACFP